MEAANSVVTKNTSAVAMPTKSQDFKETLRSASDPKIHQPIHGGNDAKSDKNGHEEKKEQVETASLVAVATAPQLAGTVIVPAVRQGVSESLTEDTDAASTPVRSEAIASTAFPLQVQMASDLPEAKEDRVPSVLTEATRMNGKQEAAARSAEPGEVASGPSSTDGTIDKAAAGSAKADDDVTPVGTLAPMTPVLTADSISVMSVVDPLQDAGDAMIAAKSTGLDKQTSDIREAKPRIADAPVSQAAAQVPSSIQQFASLQATPGVEAFKNAEGGSTKVKAAGGASGNGGSKGKTTVPDLRGKHEDAKVDSQSPDGTSAAQPTSKMPVPLGATELNTAQTGANQGTELAGSAQAVIPNILSGDPSQGLTDAKTGAGENVSATPSAPAPSNFEAMATSALSSAHLVQSIHQSEMKLGMNSAEFGSISISTAVSHQVLSAQISLDHPELSRVLSSHLSTVEEKLGQAYGLQAKVEVRDGGTSSYGGAQHHEKGSSQSLRGHSLTGVGAGVSGNAVAPGATTVAASATARLDIRI